MATTNILGVFEPQTAHFPSSNFGTFDTRNNHPVIDLDDTTQETIYFKGRMPANYSGGGITVEIHYAMTSATTGGVVFEAAFERVSDSIQDIDSDGFAAANATSAITVPGTSGHVDITTITFTDGADMDSVTAGDGYRLSIARDADSTNATDDATGDAEIWLIVVKET